MKAHDKDTGVNGELTFKLQGSGNKNFSIASNGFVLTETPLDFETKSFYVMTVVAEDGGKPPKTASAQVNITIINVNDNVPVFEKSSQVTKIREDVAIGTRVVRLNATDSDGSQLTFEIVGGNEGGSFQISNATGLITVAAKLDHETRVNYTLVVKATDTGALSVLHNATVQVLDVNDNSPAFAPLKYAANVSENQKSGTR